MKVDKSKCSCSTRDDKRTTHYKCVGCKKWFCMWQSGCADCMPNHCDDCWYDKHGTSAALKRVK